MLFEAYGRSYEAESFDQANKEFLWTIEEFHFDSNGYWHRLSEERFVWIAGNYFD